MVRIKLGGRMRYLDLGPTSALNGEPLGRVASKATPVHPHPKPAYRSRRRLPRYTDEEIWVAVEEHGTQAAAARALGISDTRVHHAMKGRN